MEGSERSRLRAMVNVARRAEVAAEEAGFPHCSGCGGRLSNWTWDCPVCRERFRSLRRRGVIARWEWDELTAAATGHTAQERQRMGSEGGHPGDFWNLYPDRLERQPS